VSNALLKQLPPRSIICEYLYLHAYIIVIYFVSLCESEGLLLDLDGVQRHGNKGNRSYLVIALQGQIKGEHHERHHLLPLVLAIQSGQSMLPHS
jgi:hypothetical protein